jgi:hypothetical protein
MQAHISQMHIGCAPDVCSSDVHPMNGMVTKAPQEQAMTTTSTANDNDNNKHAIRNALTMMMMPFWHRYRCCSMLDVKIP